MMVTCFNISVDANVANTIPTLIIATATYLDKEYLRIIIINE